MDGPTPPPPPMKQRQTSLEVCFPAPQRCAAFFFFPLSPSRHENEYCRLLHLFVFSTFVCGSRKTTEEPDSKQSSVKREEGLEEKKQQKNAMIVYA